MMIWLFVAHYLRLATDCLTWSKIAGWAMAADAGAGGDGRTRSGTECPASRGRVVRPIACLRQFHEHSG
jgi:hypothetical protein